MAEIKNTTTLFSQPGVQRDGTLMDLNFFTEAQWCRFQRGRPKKMGGYTRISNLLTGPIRQQYVWSNGPVNHIYSFSPSTIELCVVDSTGLGSNIYNLTPAGFTSDSTYTWTVDTMFDAAGENTIIIAVANTSLTEIDDDTPKQVFYAIAGVTTGAFVPLSTLEVSGGIVAVHPYLVYYGADGQAGWSDANQPQTLDSGEAASARVTSAKVVKGLPVRGGQGPSGLLWSLDSLIKMDWVGGAAVFRFSVVSNQSSILSQNSPIEYDGSFYWVGVDRFLQYSGGQISETPNTFNLNWFFDNVNYEERQKVWAMKVPRYGEIWWFFPYGTATECTHAVILNVREKIWYDIELARSAGYYSQVFHYPVMGTAEENPTTKKLVVTVTSGTVSVGDVLSGTTSGSSATVTQIPDATHLIVNMTIPGDAFTDGEGLADLTSGATLTVDSTEILCAAFVHEKGRNAIEGELETPIDSWFDTCEFGFPTGSAQPNQLQGPNRWTRLIRIEPDFIQEGEMSVVVKGKEFARSDDVVSNPYFFDATTEKIDMREQRREIRLQFRSAAIDGHFEMGNVLLHLEPGDVRS